MVIVIVLIIGDNDINFAKVFSPIKNTMSDLGPVNSLFNSQLKLLKEIGLIYQNLGRVNWMKWEIFL